MEFESQWHSFYSIISAWKCRMPNVVPFVSAPICFNKPVCIFSVGSTVCIWSLHYSAGWHRNILQVIFILVELMRFFSRQIQIGHSTIMIRRVMTYRAFLWLASDCLSLKRPPALMWINYNCIMHYYMASTKAVWGVVFNISIDVARWHI